MAASTGFAESRPAPAWWIGFALVALLALGLRTWNLTGPYEQYDEQIAVAMSGHLATHPGWDTNWKDVVPNFSKHDQYNFSAYLYATHLFRGGLSRLANTSFQRDRDGLYVHRLFSALTGTAAVLLLMLVAGRVGGGITALGAGLLAALNPQLVQDAHYARPEAFMVLLLMAVLGLAQLKVNLRTATIMGLLVGLLVATKASNGLFLLVPLAAVLMDATSGSDSGWRRWRKAGALCLVIGLSALAGWAVGVPGAVLHWEKYVAGLRVLAEQYSGSHPPHSYPDYRPVWGMMGDYYRATLGWPLLVAVALGSLVALGQSPIRRLAVSVLPSMLLSLWVFGSHRVFFERNLSLVVPGALLLVAIGAGWLFRALLSSPVARGAALAAAWLVLAAPSLRTVQLFNRSLRPSPDFTNFLAEARRDFPQVPLVSGTLYDPGELDRVAHEMDAAGGKVLYVFSNFNDAYTARLMPELGRRFHAAVIGEYQGTFADYPTCTLNAIHGSRWHVYLLMVR